MKKQIKKTIVASSLIVGLTSTLVEGVADAKSANNGAYEGEHYEICVEYKKCDNLNTYITYATSAHTLQHLDDVEAYEPNKNSKLMKGAYYTLTYWHDTPIKAYKYTPTKQEKKALDKRIKYIKAKQKQLKKRGALRMVYTYGVQY